ncbi:hypothetical protein LguiB_032057 [Lonicera macranthoides]
MIPGDPLMVFRTWNNSLHFCNWRGVTCSTRHQRITVLDLASLELAGSVSPQIGNLTFLREISLGNNTFTGELPQEIGRLSRLQNLYISNNSFQGKFPKNISRCSNLKVIDIYDNDFVGEIPTELGSLSSLLHMHLSKNHFSGRIPPSLGNLSALRLFIVNKNSLHGEIPSELGRLSKLEAFQVFSNNLTGMIPLQLFNISSITSFAVLLNQLTGELPSNLGLTLPNLQEFYFALNNFSGPFPPSLSNASKLTLFDIAWNSFTGPIPMNLGSLHNLEKVSLGLNKLGNGKPDDLSFLNSMSNCTKLTRLFLVNNGFGGVLPNSIANFSRKLTVLRLDGNYIIGSIPNEIGNLVSLDIVALNENLLEGTIPESIGKLSKLQGLYLYNNNISGEIPSSIGNMTRLSVFASQVNMLEGSIPISLGNCKNLQALDLESNQLTGLIPMEIIGLTSLTIGLFLNKNHLIGPLPSQVGSLKNLGQLDVSGNRLTGTIPSSLGDCQVLEYLYMQDNLFEGTIPSTFERLKGIQVLNLSHNNLSGEIPRLLGELPLIQHLDLSFNSFEGEVPDEGAFKNMSSFSLVGNTNLCGGIQALQLPTCPKDFPKDKGKRFPHRLIPILIIVPIVILLACLFAILYRLRKSKKMNDSDSELQNEYPKVSYGELLQATNGFSSTNLIGEGSFGSVYKGILNPQNQIVAVKVLNLQQSGAAKSFLAECETLRNIRHRNLIKIITTCSSTDFKGNEFKALVLEFMPNGSLEDWLHQDRLNRGKLNLLHRLNMAIDVANALDYLHHHCETSITHCDLKPSNVLLDEDLCAHVSDFGLAKFHLATTSQSNLSQASSMAIRGTIGYVAPGGDLVKVTSSVSSLQPLASQRAAVTIEIETLKLILENNTKEDDEQVSSHGGERRANNSNMEVCLAAILQVGVSCSVESPLERIDIGEALVELNMDVCSLDSTIWRDCSFIQAIDFTSIAGISQNPKCVNTFNELEPPNSIKNNIDGGDGQSSEDTIIAVPLDSYFNGIDCNLDNGESRLDPNGRCEQPYELQPDDDCLFDLPCEQSL